MRFGDFNGYHGKFEDEGLDVVQTLCSKGYLLAEHGGRFSTCARTQNVIYFVISFLGHGIKSVTVLDINMATRYNIYI